MRNFEWCVYTYRHRRAFQYTLEKLVKDPDVKARMMERAKWHDLDKVLKYLYMDQLDAQMAHVHEKAHHLENELPRVYEDYLETVIDYECAPYTKPDKPLNAYDFVMRFHGRGLIKQEIEDRILAIIRELGINASYDLTQDAEGMAFVNSIGEVTEDMILEEALGYLPFLTDEELAEEAAGLKAYYDAKIAEAADETVRKQLVSEAEKIQSALDAEKAKRLQ